MGKNRGRELAPPLQENPAKADHDEAMGEKTVAVDLVLVLEICLGCLQWQPYKEIGLVNKT